jgi:hypothetical protein
MARIGQSILSIFVSIIEKIVTEWLVGFTLALVGAKITDKIKILSTAPVAGAYAYTSVMATVPFPLNMALAPAMAAATGALTGMASAAGGWDVPADSMAMLHKNEMVLPASLAANVREGFGGGGATTVNAPISIAFTPARK